MTAGSYPPEIEARQQLTTGLLRWLLSLESPDVWTRRQLTVQPLASGQVRYQLIESSEDGVHRETDLLADGVAEAVRTLQQYMYSPTGGAWVTAELVVTAEGQGDAQFNYDAEPQIPGPDGAPGGMSDEDVAAHLQTFPRPSVATPGWMQRQS
jgi:hypothetical protein